MRRDQFFPGTRGFPLRVVCLLMACAALLPRETGACRAGQPTEAELQVWTADLVRSKRLALDFYDPKKPPRPLPGWTDFEFELQYRYECDVIPRSAKSPAVIRIRFQDVQVPIKHRVLLPATLDAEAWLRSPLGRHESDHVRIGAHPRVVLLGRALVHSLQRIPVPDDVSTPTPQWIEQQIATRLGGRRDALQAVIQATNRGLDSITDHGARPLPEDATYLESAFSKEQLHELKFPYLSEVRNVVEGDEYRTARLVFRPPPESPKP